MRKKTSDRLAAIIEEQGQFDWAGSGVLLTNIKVDRATLRSSRGPLPKYDDQIGRWNARCSGEIDGTSLVFNIGSYDSMGACVRRGITVLRRSRYGICGFDIIANKAMGTVEDAGWGDDGSGEP